MVKKKQKKLLGQILLEYRYITQEQLDEALRIKEKNPDKYLGHILIDMGIPQSIINKALDSHRKRAPIGQIFIDLNFINRMQLQEALIKQKESHKPIGDTLISLGFVTKDQYLVALSKHYNMPIKSLEKFNISKSLQKITGEKFALKNKIIVLENSDNLIQLAIARPSKSLIDDLYRFLPRSKRIELFLASIYDIEHLLKSCYLTQNHLVDAKIETKQIDFSDIEWETLDETEKQSLENKQSLIDNALDSHGKRKPIGQILIDQNFINRKQLQEALISQKNYHKPFGDTLISLGFVTKDQYLFALSEHFNLPQKSLENVNISKYLQKCIGVDLSKADFSGTDLSGANFCEAKLDGANFKGTNLIDADLSGADLSGADLSEAKLIRADFSKTNLTDANLNGADLKFASLRLSNIKRANFNGVDLREAYLVGVDLNQAYNLTSLEICRFIEFPAEYFQSGISILNYFGTVLKKKDPESNAKIRIEQDGLKISMTIDPMEGDKEIIEKTLEEYGLVITGEMSIEEFTNHDKLFTIELKNELRIAKARVESQKELLQYKDDQIKDLKEMNFELLNTIKIGVQNKANVHLHASTGDNINIKGKGNIAVGKDNANVNQT